MSSNQTGLGRTVLFVCIENSSRSVMAEGFAKRLSMVTSSAGTFPATRVNPLVVQAMKEVGIDVSHSKPKELTGDMIDAASLVVLTDASLQKSIPGGLLKKLRKKVVKWHIPDPQGKSIEEIRSIRDEIEAMTKSLKSE